MAESARLECRDPLFGSGSQGSAFMSQHNIVKSEAFEKAPFVYIRTVRSGGLRRRRARMALAFVAGAVVAVAVGAVATVLAFGPALGI
ncbi:MAG: hypothetical protein ACI8U3_000833 [Brevundimonas sp.]|jgi:hypothetical protein